MISRVIFDWLLPPSCYRYCRVAWGTLLLLILAFMEETRNKKRAFKIIFLGAPAAGKGTQAIKMQEKLGARQLSSGDILREFVARGGEEGQRLKSIMDS